MAIFKGVGTALITPFDAEKQIDYNQFAELIEFQIKNGADSIIVCGTTGESATLTHEEHIECIRFAVEKVNKRIPVVAGTGSNSTDASISLSIEAQKCGADGLLLVSPYYNKATQNGLVEHFSDIAKAVDLPIILYNIPSRTGVNILPDTIIKLTKLCDNIVGVKEACSDIKQITKIMAMADGGIDLYSGNDDQIVPILAVGGIGVISVVSNIIPKTIHDMVFKYLEGDIKGSLDLQLNYFHLLECLTSEVNPIPIKAAAARLGLCKNILRKPLGPMSPVNEKELMEEMKRLNLC